MISDLVHRIERTWREDASPRRVRDILVDLLTPEHGELSACELAERYEARVMSHIRRSQQECARVGIEYWCDFNPVSAYHIQGPCFVQPNDAQTTASAKRRRLLWTPMRTALEGLTDAGFETICAALLNLLGAREYHQTRISRDQGIDFFGRLYLSDLDKDEFPFLRFEHNMSLWVIGQAKHYVRRKVGTPAIRDLVGAVNLARSKEYAHSTDVYPSLTVRSCDPVLVLFLTTGTYTSDAVQLARNSGLVCKNIDDIAKYLADRNVGVNPTSGQPETSCLVDWGSGVLHKGIQR